jgi:hypothetical protein
LMATDRPFASSSPSFDLWRRGLVSTKELHVPTALETPIIELRPWLGTSVDSLSASGIQTLGALRKRFSRRCHLVAGDGIRHRWSYPRLSLHRLSVLGVIRPPSFGIYRPREAEPKGVSKQLFSSAILTCFRSPSGWSFWTPAGASDRGTKARLVPGSTRCDATDPA